MLRSDRIVDWHFQRKLKLRSRSDLSELNRTLNILHFVSHRGAPRDSIYDGTGGAISRGGDKQHDLFAETDFTSSSCVPSA